MWSSVKDMQRASSLRICKQNVIKNKESNCAGERKLRWIQVGLCKVSLTFGKAVEGEKAKSFSFLYCLSAVEEKRNTDIL